MTTVPPLKTEPASAVRAGADLRAARERLDLSLSDIAATLRIRPPHLEALEEGRISLLPGNAYVLAFVRTYASALGLDAEEMVRRFRAEATAVGHQPDLVFPIPMPERGLPAGALVLLGLVLAVGTYAGWYHLSGDGRLPAETVTPVPERLAPLAEQVPQAEHIPLAGQIPLAPPRQPLPITGAVPQVSLADPTPDPTPSAMAFSPTSAAAAQLPPHPIDPAQAAGLPQAGPGTPRILLRANADSWLLIKDRTGAVLLNRVLKSGEVWPVPDRSDLLMTTGNAGGTEIMVDGAVTMVPGGNGAVRRDLSLDPDQIKDGKLATAAVAPVASARARQ